MMVKWSFPVASSLFTHKQLHLVLYRQKMVWLPFRLEVERHEEIHKRWLNNLEVICTKHNDYFPRDAQSRIHPEPAALWTVHHLRVMWDKKCFKALKGRWHFIFMICQLPELLCSVVWCSLSFCSLCINQQFIHKPWCLSAFGTAHKHTVKKEVYIYLVTIFVFLISNGLYLTTVYDEVNDPQILCMILVLVLAYSI